MDRNEPILQMTSPDPILTETTRSVTKGALSAITLDSKPIKLNKIRSINMFG